MQGELYNLEKADILELTVNQLRQMITSTELQCAVGYSACVQEVNNFLVSIQYDDVTRRRIVQHLCRRRQFVTAQATHATTSSSQLIQPEAELMMTSSSLSDNSGIDYKHLRMCSVHADSTTGLGDGFEPSTTTLVVASSSRNIPSAAAASAAAVENIPSTTPEPDQSVAASACVARQQHDPTNCNNNKASVVDAIDDYCDNINNNNNNNDSNKNEVAPADVWRPW